MAHLLEKEVFAKTVYAEARGESELGQTWVAWVIKNRARLNRKYWGGGSIKGVCLHKYQFECWNNKIDISVNEPYAYQRIRRLTDSIYDENDRNDPTGGADHYYNPDKAARPGWVDNVKELQRIGNHVFYRGP